MPYERRQADYLKITKLKIGDKAYISKVENHLYFPFMVNIPIINSYDRSEVLTVVDINEEFILVKSNDSTLLKVPYSLVYKLDGSIIYPKSPKNQP